MPLLLLKGAVCFRPGQPTVCGERWGTTRIGLRRGGPLAQGCLDRRRVLGLLPTPFTISGLLWACHPPLFDLRGLVSRVNRGRGASSNQGLVSRVNRGRSRRSQGFRVFEAGDYRQFFNQRFWIPIPNWRPEAQMIKWTRAGCFKNRRSLFLISRGFSFLFRSNV